MFRLSGRLLALAVAVLPLAPPEHVHEVEENGHHEIVVHRHSQAHGLPNHAASQDGVFDHGDDLPVTLTTAYIVPTAPALVGAAPSVAFAIIEPPAPRTFHRAAEYVELLIHGPPRAPASLRAPPSLPAV
jgi:hypothetical protein